MSFFVSNDFELCPVGVHLARCYRIVDLGTQKNEFMGEVKYLHKITMSWEIHGTVEDGTPLRMKDGRPYSIFKNYTLSWSQKANLRNDLQSWRGKPFSQDELRRFDLKSVLGAWCMLNVIERQGNNGKTYSNVDGITPVPAMIKTAGLPTPVNKLELFNLSDPDMEMFNTFGKKLQEKIMSSPEWQKRNPAQPGAQTSQAADDTDENIPF